ncbi:MAG: 2-dehydro-3-deoxy-6-phosphogalactonate aldolase [Kiloniellales bacterium]
MDLLDALNELPLVAILRGIAPGDAAAIGDVLVEAGFTAIEVPLDRPDALDAIAALSARFGDMVALGAGTVMDVEDVAQLPAAGGRFVVMPNTDPAVIEAAKATGLQAMPGFATPSEAFTALKAGADALKLFPAEAAPPPVLRAMKAVLPKDVPVLPTGGIAPDAMAAYWAAGAGGFGIGSALYRPGASAADVAAAAAAFMAAFEALPPEP